MSTILEIYLTLKGPNEHYQCTRVYVRAQKYLGAAVSLSRSELLSDMTAEMSLMDSETSAASSSFSHSRSR
jgi:hypothetical protein